MNRCRQNGRLQSDMCLDFTHWLTAMDIAMAQPRTHENIWDSKNIWGRLSTSGGGASGKEVFIQRHAFEYGRLHDDVTCFDFARCFATTDVYDSTAHGAKKKGSTKLWGRASTALIAAANLYMSFKNPILVRCSFYFFKHLAWARCTYERSFVPIAKWRRATQKNVYQSIHLHFTAVYSCKDNN